MARSQYGDANFISHGDWLSKTEDAIRQKPFVSGHFGFAFAKRMLGERYSFTFLRDPVDRIVSLYSFCRSQKPETYPVYGAASKLDIDQFVALGSQFAETPVEQFQCHSMIWNNQAWQLAYGWDYCPKNKTRGPIILDYSEKEVLKMAKSNIEKFDYVGFTETFAEDAREIYRNLGLGRPRRILHANSSRGQRSSSLNQATVAAIQAVTELDREIYAYAKTLYRRRNRRFWQLPFGAGSKVPISG